MTRELRKMTGKRMTIMAELMPRYQAISNLHSTIMATKTATLNAMVSA